MSRSMTARSGYCPVCGMEVKVDGALASQMFFSDNTKLMFESPADMIAFYVAPEKYSADESRRPGATIVKMVVKDYNSKQIMPGDSATFVYKSRVSGPMGNDTFAFETADDAAQFAASNGGSIVKLAEITPEMIEDLRR